MGIGGHGRRRGGRRHRGSGRNWGGCCCGRWGWGGCWRLSRRWSRGGSGSRHSRRWSCGRSGSRHSRRWSCSRGRQDSGRGRQDSGRGRQDSGRGRYGSCSRHHSGRLRFERFNLFPQHLQLRRIAAT